MRILVLSDAHGRTAPVEQAIERSQPEILLFLGDGLQELHYLEALYPTIVFHVVKGNCDFSDAPGVQRLQIGGKRIFMTHGHLYGVKYSYETAIAAAEKAGADLLLFGHTHIAHQDYQNGLYILNPGSVAFPRSGKPSYGWVDIVDRQIITNIVYF